MGVNDGSDLLERFVRAALRGDLHLPEAHQLSQLEPEIPELVEPLYDFYTAIEIFVSKVNRNRGSGPGVELERAEATELEVEAERAAATEPNLSDRSATTSTSGRQHETPTPPSSEINPTVPPDALVDVAFRIEDGVITLFPKNKRECQDLPFLAAQACKHGAGDAGVFKYVLSKDCDISVNRGQVPSASSFTSSRNTTGAFCVTYHQSDEPMTVAPTDPQEIEPQTLAALLENIIKDPEQLKQMRYCTDHPAQTAEQRRACGLPVQSPIHPLPHNRLDDTLYGVDGLHWPYLYLGRGFFTLHREDQELWSINLEYFGTVLWLTIDPKDAAVIENLDSQWTCDQKIRHERRYFTRSELDELGVSYRLFIQQAGEAVVVFGKTYHQGGNIVAKMAEAVNYGPLTWSVGSYKECRRGRRGCPGYPIPNAYLQFRQPGEAQRRADDAPEDEVQDNELIGKSRKEGNRMKMSSKPPNRAVLSVPDKRKSSRSHLPMETKRRKLRDPNPASQPGNSLTSTKVLKLVAAILSMPAIVAFCDLVRARRHNETPVNYWVADDDDEYQLEQRLRNLDRIQGRSVQNKFVVRVHEFELALFMKHKRKGRIRNDPQDIKNVVNRTKWNYEKFRRHANRGRKWLEIFESYPGLLCFLLVDDHNPFGVSRADYLSMSDSDISTFQAMLVCDHTKSISEVGERFMRSLSPIAEDVEFRWEAETVLWHKLTMPQALKYLKPLVGEVDNIYQPEKYPEWSRPLDWPDHRQWPTNPTSILGDPQCDLCSDSHCICITTELGRIDRMQPRIKDYADKGRGIRAVAKESGQVAYAEGAHIGVLSGEIVPTGTHHGNMLMDFNHPDILYEPVVCQIDFAQSGSYLRLVNHSCRPSARVKVMRVSGQYRLVVIATRDIYDAEEITADFKRESLDRPCLCGTKKCRERPDGARTTTNK